VYRGRCQIFTAGVVRGGNLKTWKTGKLASRPAMGPARISEFQFFTRPGCTIPGAGHEGDSERPISGGVDVHWMAIITLMVITVLPSSARSGHSQISNVLPLCRRNGPSRQAICTTEYVKGCKMPAPSRRPVSLHKHSTGRRLTSLEGGNRGTKRCGHGRQ